ncbi:MAG TPA: dipicolinate synthase subunit DpsA [Desulfobacteria bacterium]|nr:dipicolinate synthase subunit DpsA [Desulfobacteria bacterium]
MSSGLRGIRLAIVGGDDRELVLIPELAKMGAYIKVIGFEHGPHIDGIEYAATLSEAVNGVDAVVLPMPGTDERGVVRAKYSKNPLQLSKEFLQIIPPNVPVFIGWARPALQTAARALGLKLVEYNSLDELTILNSIPSAEGAIQMAMEATKITIHGSEAMVVGFGRSGFTLACTLKGMGAHVSLVARKQSDLARAFQLGMQPVHFLDLAQNASEMNLIFNTVPSLVLDRQVLDNVDKEAVIIDIASAPGGTDFEYASFLGIKALLAPGLPGIVAPKTAGKILAQVLPQVIIRQLVTLPDRVPVQERGGARDES